MFNRNMTENPGFGCSLQLLFMILIPVIILWSGYRLLYSISDFGKVEYIPTSSIAAQRCRDKFNSFKGNEYVRQITLTEIEINSALQEDLQKDSTNIAHTWVKLNRDQFILEGLWSIVDLSTSEKEVSSLELKSKGESLWRFRIRFKMVGQLKVLPGELRIVSPEIHIGRFKLPDFVVSSLKRVRPGLFVYSILPQIKHVWLKSGAIEIIK